MLILVSYICGKYLLIKCSLYKGLYLVKIRHYIILGIVIAVAVGTQFTIGQLKEASAGKKKPKVYSEYTIQTKVLTVQNTSYPAKISFTGRVKSIDRIDLFAEVSGILKSSRRAFKVGNHFKKGEVLVRLDDTEMSLQLISNKLKFVNTITKLIPDLRVDYPDEAQAWEDYLVSINTKNRLPVLPKITNKKLLYFISGRNVNDAFYEIRSQESKLGKFTIYAPFNGIVKSSSINTGTLVRVGQPLGEFISTDAYELEAPISFKQLKFIELGHKVKLYSNDFEKEWVGEIYRISDVINESTQTINIYIKILENDVKEGMYLRGEVDGKMITNSFAVPRLLLLQDNQLYIVEEGLLNKVDVNVLKINDDLVIVKGLKDGVDIVAKPLTRVLVGAKVEIVK